MKTTLERKNWGNLVAALVRNRSHFKLANDQLKTGIDNFCHRLQTENIIHSSINSSGTAWKSKSLISCFCETFDPILTALFPQNSYAYHYLKLNQVQIPLADHLIKKESCSEFSSNVKTAIYGLERLIPVGDQFNSPHQSVEPSEWNLVCKDGESLELLASLLDAIYQELNLNDEVKWCEVCFRIARNVSNYCDTHNPSENDTNYRRGLKIKKSIPKSENLKFLRLRSKRNSFKEDFFLITAPSDMPDEITHKTNCLPVDNFIKKLVSDTESQQWKVISKAWGLVLQTIPVVSKRFDNDPNNFHSWDEFLSALLIAIDNLHEKTKHPYWILLMLAEAEIWFSIEDSFTKLSPTSKKNEIERLLSQGLRNSEIVKQLSVSNAYVSELRKRKPKYAKRNKLPIFGGAANKNLPKQI